MGPKLIYLVGLPGSGKSRYAETWMLDHPDSIYISSDRIRGELYGDENCQDDPGRVFDLMQKRTLDALKEGKEVIYDATNVVRKNRIALLKNIPNAIVRGGYVEAVNKVCVVVWAKLEDCINRDSFRDRHVGEKVIMKMAKRFQTPWYDEGWNEIQIYRDELDCYHYDDFNLDIPHDNPHHPGTIQEHVQRVIHEVVRLKEHAGHEYNISTEDASVLLKVAMFHDIGKPLTKTFVNKKNETTEIAHYYDHQNVSAYITLGSKFLSAQDDALFVSYLVNMHMEPFFSESNYYKNMKMDIRRLVELFNECDRAGA